MKVILKEDVLNLGFKDDIVDVKDGYGRNFLIPRGKAVIASESAKKVLAEELRQRAHKLEQVKKSAEELAAKLEDVRLTIPVKTTEQGTIYGSVSNMQIHDKLVSMAFDIDRKKIQVPGNIKEVGEYIAKILLHRDVTVEIPFEVISESVVITETKEEE